jgi:predicted phosphoribosyltransferase
MNQGQIYDDRHEAGHILASHVKNKLGDADDVVVLALPRGGVPVGFEVARSLGAPLDVFVVRKLGAPGFEEYAIGAIAAGGFRMLNEDAIRELHVSDRDLAEVTSRESEELQRRQEIYHAGRPPVRIVDRVAILVDDGLATGFTMRAAIAAVREQRPRRLMVAVPVGAAETCDEIEREVDDLVCPLRPYPFRAVGLWYRHFEATQDDEVRECLQLASTSYEKAEKL